MQIKCYASHPDTSRSIKRALMMCVASVALSTAVAAADLRISHQWKAETDARDRAARILATEAQKRAPQLKISIHPELALKIDPVEQYDALLDGRIEMSIFPLFYLSPRVPELSITLLPGAPASVEQAMRLKGSDFHKRLQELCESKGFHVLTWWWLAGGLVGSEPEIGGPDDMKALDVRSGDPVFDLMFESLGAVPQVMPSTKIAENLKSGKLDLAQASLESLTSLRLYEAAKSAVIGGPALYVALQPLIISMTAWKALTDAERKALEAAADIADDAFELSQRDVVRETTAVFTKAGVKVREMRQDEYEAWIKIANETSWATYRAQGTRSSALLTSMLTSLMASSGK